MRPTIAATTLLFAALPRLASAQVNTEKLRLSPEEEGVTSSLALALTTKSGNLDYFDAMAEFGVGWRKGDDLAFMVASTRFAAKRTRDDRIAAPDDSLWTADSRYTNAHMAAARYNRFFSERIIGEVFSQVEFNQFLMLDLRTLGGLGPRFVLFEEDKSAGFLGLGYMAEYERLAPDEIASTEKANILAHRLTSYLTFTADLASNATISSTAYYQPRLDNPADFRIYNETDLSVDLTQRLSLSISFKLRHDSQPPALAEETDEDGTVLDLGDETTLKPTDTQMVNKLNWKF